MKKILFTFLVIFTLFLSSFIFNDKQFAQERTYNTTNLACGANVNGEDIHIDLRYPESISTSTRSFVVEVTGGNLGSDRATYFRINQISNNIEINDEDANGGDLFIENVYPINNGAIVDPNGDPIDEDGDGWIPAFIDGHNNSNVGDQVFIMNFRTSSLVAGGPISIISSINPPGNTISCDTININVVDDAQLNQRCGGSSNASFGTFDESSSEMPFELCLLETEEAVVREFNEKTQSKANQIGSDTTFDQTKVDGDGIYTSKYKVKSSDTVYIVAYSVAQDGSETLIGEKDLSGRQPQSNEEVDRLEGCALEDDGQPNVSCQKCIDAGGIWIAIGCVDPTPLGIMTRIVQTGIGVMGGVALVQLIIVGLYLQSGQEAKIAEGKKKLIATLTGIVVLVFSVLILRIIGVNVLDAVPGGFL